MVFAGLYPVDADQYAELRDALEKLRLNDSSFFYEPETSTALGFGFRCGFLGLLHMEIVQERLEREFNLELLVTAPSVRYRVHEDQRGRHRDRLPGQAPRPRLHRGHRGADHHRHHPRQRRVRGADPEAVRGEARASRRRSTTSRTTRVMIQYELPLNEILLDFFDRLKSASKGYASLDYEFTGYWVSPLVKLDVLVNGEPVDALSLIVHRESAFPRGKSLVEKMRKLIPRQMFEVAIQAAIGSRVIARETVQALRKNVIAKCYGGDISPQAQAPREAEGRQEADEARRDAWTSRRRPSWPCCGWTSSLGRSNPEDPLGVAVSDRGALQIRQRRFLDERDRAGRGLVGMVDRPHHPLEPDLVDAEP